jgi:hypothetical protein
MTTERLANQNLSVELFEGYTTQYVEGSWVAVAPLNTARLRYASGALEVSISGGAYAPLTTGPSSPWTTAGGNVVEVNPLLPVLVGTATAVGTESLQVSGSVRATLGILASNPAGTNAFLELGRGSTAALSPVGSGRLRYDEVTGEAQISLSGGPYVAIGAGGVSPWATAGGNIVQTNPALRVLVGTGAALTADEFQVLGNAYVQGALSATSSVTASDYAGGFVSLTTATGYLEATDQNAAGLSAVGSGRLRYSSAATGFQVSAEGGGYASILTSANVPQFAYVQGGNAFGALAQLGTTDANALALVTGNTEKARLTTAGEFLIGYTAPVAGETLGVNGTLGVNFGGFSLSIDSGVIYTDSPSLYLISDSIFLNGTVFISTKPLSVSNGIGLAGEVLLSQGAGLAPAWGPIPVAPGSWAQGGNSFGALGALGTNDAYDVAFRTNGTEKARLTTGGAFLVGYSAPVGSETLGVLGDAYVSGKLTVLGALDPTSLRLSGSNAGYIEAVDQSLAAVSAAGEGRIRYNSAANSWEASVNGSGYAALITSATLPNAWNQGGNVFGTTGIIGTNDAYDVAFRANGYDAMRLTTAGALLIGYSAPVVGEALGVRGIFAVGDGTYTLQIDPFAISSDALSLVITNPYLTLVGQINFNTTQFAVNGSAGTSGQVLQSQGAGLAPIWGSVPTPANVWIQGGNSFGALGALGTNDAYDVALQTSGTEKARLTTGGAFLVGYTTPVDAETLGTSSNLHVGGRALFGTNAFGGTETIRVHGSALIDNDGAKTAYIEMGKGSNSAVSAANHGSLRFNELTNAFQVSINGAAYTNLITASALPSTAYVQGGNAFGAVAQLGTTDANALTLLTNGTEKARLTTGGVLAIGYAAASGTELLRVKGRALLDDDTANTSALEFGHGSSAPVAAATHGAIRYNESTSKLQVSLNGAAYVDIATGTTPANAFVQGGNAFGALAQLGTTDANALAFLTGGSERARFTAGGVLAIGAVAASGTESLRVSGGGALVDGSAFVASVTSTLTLNNSGGAIGIGTNADAQPINVGTGASNRTITLGNTTAGTNVYVASPLYVRNANGLQVTDASSNGLILNQASGTVHQWSGTGTTTTMKVNPTLQMAASITTASDGTNTIGSESNRFQQMTAQAMAVKSHSAFTGSLAYTQTGAVQTTTGAATTLFTLALPDNSGTVMVVNITARDTASGNRAAYQRIANVYRQGGGGATLNVGVVATASIESVAAWDATISVSGNNAIVQVTGAAATTINWACSVQHQTVLANT